MGCARSDLCVFLDGIVLVAMHFVLFHGIETLVAMDFVPFHGIETLLQLGGRLIRNEEIEVMAHRHLAYQ